MCVSKLIEQIGCDLLVMIFIQNVNNSIAFTPQSLPQTYVHCDQEELYAYIDGVCKAALCSVPGNTNLNKSLSLF